MNADIQGLSDELLIAETRRAAANERYATAELLPLLIEVERRGVHLGLGYSSMFSYCTGALLLSEQAAYSRITAARTARRFPQVLQMLSDGALTLSSIGLLAPHLTEETADAMLTAASHQSTRAVERLIAAWHPQPDIEVTVRALPAQSFRPDNSAADLLLDAANSSARALHPPTSIAEPVGPAQPLMAHTTPSRTVVAPLAPRRFLLKLTICEDTHKKLQRAQSLLRHSIPDGDVDTILDRALTLLLEQTLQTKCSATSRPRRTAPVSRNRRHIPAAVRREVWRRDGGRCVFAGADGRCGETAFLEFHHVIPFAAGGPTDASNLQLRCRSHNAYEATTFFGMSGQAMAR
jgi:5-methylcytosine-specific restriction endonuclease McrA